MLEEKVIETREGECIMYVGLEPARLKEREGKLHEAEERILLREPMGGRHAWHPADAQSDETEKVTEKS